MWTCKQCGGENPDNFAFCPACGAARPEPERPAVGRHMKPEDRENAERNVDDSFWAGLEEALNAEEEEEPSPSAEQPEEMPPEEAPQEEIEEEPEERRERSPLLLALLIFAFLLIVFSTVTALILFDRNRNAAQEDVVYEEATPTGFAAQPTSTPAGFPVQPTPNATISPEGDNEAVVVAGIMETNPNGTAGSVVVTPYPAAATPVPAATQTPVYTTPTPVYTAPAATAAPTRSYILADSASRYLTEADLGRLSWEECTLARNEIYARHGYTFGIKALSDYFNSQSWYVPGGFNADDLNQFEKENAAFILEYEKAHYGGSRY